MHSYVIAIGVAKACLSVEKPSGGWPNIVRYKMCAKAIYVASYVLTTLQSIAIANVTS